MDTQYGANKDDICDSLFGYFNFNTEFFKLH